MDMVVNILMSCAYILNQLRLNDRQSDLSKGLSKDLIFTLAKSLVGIHKMVKT